MINRELKTTAKQLENFKVNISIRIIKRSLGTGLTTYRPTEDISFVGRSSSLVCRLHYVVLRSVFSQLGPDIVNMPRIAFFSATNEFRRCVGRPPYATDIRTSLSGKTTAAATHPSAGQVTGG